MGPGRMYTMFLQRGANPQNAAFQAMSTFTSGLPGTLHVTHVDEGTVEEITNS